jgi:hypothetical protein
MDKKTRLEILELIDEYEFEKKVLEKLVKKLSETKETSEFLKQIMDDAIDELSIELDRQNINFQDGIYEIPKYHLH